MKVKVIFDYPGVDPDSEEADNIIECLEIDLDHFSEETGNVWYIDDAMEDQMKIIKISMELVIDDDIKDSFIPEYLNDKLYTDPEFFGDFGSENIELLGEFE